MGIIDQIATPFLRSRSNRNYKFILYESNLFDTALHPVTGLATAGLHTAVADLTTSARDKKIDIALNKQGSVNFRLPLNSTASSLVFGYEVVRSIVVFVDDASGVSTPVWSGPIWNAEANSDANSINITCVGWFEFLNHREFRQAVSFTNFDAGVIATRILSTANNQIANTNIVNSVADAPNTQRISAGIGGTSGEDLFAGSGDMENTQCFYDTVASITNVPATTSTAWSVSGASSMLFISDTSENIGNTIRIRSLVYPSVGSTTTLTPCDPSSNYQVRAVVNVASYIGTNTLQINIAWYTSGQVFISQAGTANYSTSGEKLTAFASPSNAAYFTAFFTHVSGFGAASTIYVDAITMSKNAVNVVPTPVTLGTVASPANPVGANRTRTYAVGSKMGPAIEELSQIESGFDFEVATVKTTVNPTINNLIANGTLETNTTGWSGAANGPIGLVSTLGLSTAIYKTGAQSMSVTTPSGASTGGVYYNFGARTSGQTVTASAWVYVTTAQSMRISLEDNTLGNGLVTSTVSVLANTWTRLTLTWTPSAAGSNAGLYIYALSGAAAQTFYVDNINVTNGVGDYDFGGPSISNPAVVTTLLRQFNVVYDVVKAGIKGIGTDRPNVIFGHRWGANNVRFVRESHDTGKLVNRMNGRASGKLAMAQDITSIGIYGIFEDSTQISDANIADASLLGYAGAEVAYRSYPFKIYNTLPFPYDGGTGRVPRFWIDYEIGDICYLVADNGAMQVGRTGSPQAIRIFGATISVDMEGNEKIESLQTAAS